MKKIKLFSIALAALMAVSTVGCTSNIPSSQVPGGAAGAALKTGYAVMSGVGSSADAGEKDGLAQTDSTVVAVLVDDAGKIAACEIDGVQTKINFDKTGKLLTDKATAVKSKNELGDEYGLKKASKIGKEWNEQAAAFAQYAVGKTVQDLKGIAVNEKGNPTGAELTSSVTISISGFVGAVEKAVASAQGMGAKTGDKLGLGTMTNVEKSADAGEKEGVAQAYSTYTIASIGADGKVTSCLIDASQTNVNFDKAGKITTDLKAELKTKVELGDAYGMKKASSIGKEWGEEATAYAKYVTGKTLDEIKGVAVNEEGTPTAAELTSSVTIGIGDFNKALEKAFNTAK